MPETMFFDEGGYYIWCFAAEDGAGKFEASATFERKQDFTEGKTLIPGVRHLIKESFDNSGDALSAAAQMALAKAKNGDVGL